MLQTQREISVFGKMKATDREGDLLEYTVIKGGQQMRTFMNDVIRKNGGENADVLPYVFPHNPSSSSVGCFCARR